MAYRLDNDGSIVIDGFENGIGESPYQTAVSSGGLTDMRNVNIISIPGEASVSFATSKQSFGSFSGSVASASLGADTITYSGETGTPVNGMALVFAGGSLPTGVSAGTQSASADTNVYWINFVDTGAKTFKLYTDPLLANLVDITGTGTGTFATIDMVQPNNFDFVTGTYLVDTIGRVWASNSGANWTFFGNTTRTNANGNGVVTYAGYVLVFRNKRIDYTSTSSVSWVYGWQPASGASGGDAMQTAAGVNNPHQPTLGGSDNRIYYPDGNAVSWFSQNTSQTFTPTNTATYTYSPLALILPPSEIAQCNTVLGTNLLVGGNRNIAYSWDRTSSGYSPIYIAEQIISRIVTVNTNAFLFAGNRGRIYITNGSQAQLYKKLPDHLSGTIEPLFTWGGATAHKNQLYFGAIATSNGGATNSNYGGLWAIDLDTKALRLVNQLSYGTYAGYVTAVAPLSGTVAGFALYIGWNSGASTYGVDSYATNAAPYTGGQTYIISDLIPVGTFIKKKTFSQVEFKLTVPLVAGESVQLQVGNSFSGSFTNCSGYSNGTYSFVAGNNNYSANMNFSIQNQEWLKVKVILTSTASTPSYCRLKELRVY